jgi:hypothetical protein
MDNKPSSNSIMQSINETIDNLNSNTLALYIPDNIKF